MLHLLHDSPTRRGRTLQPLLGDLCGVVVGGKPNEPLALFPNALGKALRRHCWRVYGSSGGAGRVFLFCFVFPPFYAAAQHHFLLCCKVLDNPLLTTVGTHIKVHGSILSCITAGGPRLQHNVGVYLKCICVFTRRPNRHWDSSPGFWSNLPKKIWWSVSIAIYGEKGNSNSNAEEEYS